MRVKNLISNAKLDWLLVLPAALAVFACTRLPETSSTANSVKFSVTTDLFTKGAEFSGDELSPKAALYVAGTLRDPQGGISTPSTFLSGNDPATARLTHDSGRIWKFPDGKNVILPLGGYTFNALAYGADIDVGPNVPACWTPTLNAADAASGMVFTDVDTYTTPVDLMYGSANGISAANPQGTLTLYHAQAMLIFNVRFTGTAFITTNGDASAPKTYWDGTNHQIYWDGSAPKFRLDDILFVNNDGLLQHLQGQTVTTANILLRTKGTFTVDNSRTDLSASWSGTQAQDGKYKIDMTAPAEEKRSKSNLDAIPEGNLLHSGNWAQNLSQDVLYQVGNPLLVPEQPVQGFWVSYRYEGARYNTYVTLPEGTWRKGMKYIYNLEINRVGGMLTFHAAGQEIGGEYNPDNIDHNWD